MPQIDALSPVMIAAVAGAVGAVVAALVASAIGAFNLWLQRRSDERRQIRELAVQVALENWKFSCDLAMKIGPATIPPVDSYLVHAMKFVSALDGTMKDVESVRKHMRDAYAMSIAAGLEVDVHNKKAKSEPAKKD